MGDMTILLTGVTGFLGSHLLKKLIEENRFNIICLKRSFSKMDRLENLKTENIIFYDIDMIDIDKIFCENKIDIVIHMATEYGRTDKSVYNVLEANLMFPLKIVETAIRYGTKCFINTDSYFNKETLSYNYLLNYSLSKKSLLNWLKILSDKIQVINIVLEHIYGEYDNSSKFIEYVIQHIAVHKKSDIDLTHGHQRRDFIYIDDVIDAYNYILDYSISTKFQYKTFDVGTGQATELREFIEKVKKSSGSSTQLNYGKIPYRSDEIMESKADNTELKNLGWSPKYTIDNGIQRILLKYEVKISE